MNGYIDHIDRLKRKPLESPPVAFVPTMSGAEGQSRTETGSPHWFLSSTLVVYPVTLRPK